MEEFPLCNCVGGGHIPTCKFNPGSRLIGHYGDYERSDDMIEESIERELNKKGFTFNVLITITEQDARKHGLRHDQRVPVSIMIDSVGVIANAMVVVC